MFRCNSIECEFQGKYYKHCDKCENLNKVCLGHFNTGYKCNKCEENKEIKYSYIDIIIKTISKINNKIKEYLK